MTHEAGAPVGDGINADAPAVSSWKIVRPHGAGAIDLTRRGRERIPTLIVIVGLPGSGKSHLLESLVRDGELAEDRTWHDYHANSLDNTHEIAQSRVFPDVLRALLAGEKCAIADSGFCYPGQTEKLVSFFTARVPQLIVDVRYFANAAAACAHNVRHADRSDTPARIQLIGILTPNYRPPAGVPLIPVVCSPQLDPEH